MPKFQTRAYLGSRPMPQPNHGAGMWVPVDVEFPATSPAVNDLIEVTKLPAGVKCLDWVIAFPDIDTNGAPTLAYSLGTENVAGTDLGTEVWGAGLTAGQSTAIVRNASSVCSQGDTTVERSLAIKITTAAATYAGATRKGQVLLLLQA